MALLLEQLRELAGERRLARTLQAREHDDRGRVLRELQAALLPTQDRDELLVDDLDDLLSGVQRLVDLVAERSLAHLRGELLDDGQRDVGVEECATDLADCSVDVRRRELALGAEVAEGLGETIGERAEGCHSPPSLREAVGRLVRRVPAPGRASPADRPVPSDVRSPSAMAFRERMPPPRHPHRRGERPP